MSNQEKAQLFLKNLEQGDVRCDHVIAMLCGLFNLTHFVVYDKIKELAEC